EASAYTNPSRRGGTTAWPVDLNNDRYVDIVGDISAFLNYFGKAVPPVPPYDSLGQLGAPARYDIGPDPPDGYIDILGDISQLAGRFGQGCAIVDGAADANAIAPFDGYW